jgi:hypothetical protein
LLTVAPAFSAFGSTIAAFQTISFAFSALLVLLFTSFGCIQSLRPSR